MPGAEYDSDALRELIQALGSPCLESQPGENFTDTVLREATRRLLQLPRVPWQQTRTIATLPNARVTPQLCLARNLEKAAAGKIESVYVGIQWADDKDSFVADWSAQPIWALGIHAALGDRIFKNRLFGVDDDAAMLGGGA